MAHTTTLPHCGLCQNAEPLPFELTMAFQPIVDMRDHSVYAYEALVRGTDGTGAGAILSRVNADNRYAFDQSCRIKAVELAAGLKMPCNLSINFLPNAVYEPAACIRATLQAAERYQFPLNRILFEVTENERVVDKAHLRRILEEYRKLGFKTAIDDFGAGYAGLNLLAEFQPDMIKIDMDLLRDIDADKVKQAIVHGIVGVARTLGIEIIAEGIESLGELRFLLNQGIYLYQGYLFSRPEIETLPEITWPTIEADELSQLAVNI